MNWVHERCIVLFAGFILDLIFGDPQFRFHPIRLIGALIARTEKWIWKILGLSPDEEADVGRKRAGGVALVILVLGVSVGSTVLLLFLAGMVSFWVKLALECLICYQMLAMKSLKTESMKVYQAFRNDDIEGARHAVSMIVGRNTERLDQEGIVKAAVETVAENTSDGVIAPLLFMIVFGVPGIVFYKSVNTMDSMVGYRNERYRYFGTAAARLDDVCNFLPSRIAALLMILSAFLLGMDGRNAYRIWRRDRFCHKSPNSAQTESVCAGALDIQLAGDAWYFGKLHHKPTIGDAISPVEVCDIKQANRLLYLTGWLTFLLGEVVLLFVGM